MDHVHSQLEKTKIRWAWIFLAPTLITIALVAGYPLFNTILFSFTNATLDSLGEYEFIGFELYAYLLTDPGWWDSVWNTVVFALSSVAVETVLGTAVALMLNQNFKGRGLLRAAVLVPWAIPTVVSSKIWQWLYHDKFGLLNDVLADLGLIDISKPVGFMANPDLLMASVVAVDVWKTTPFMALLILAGLGTIPGSLSEAARIDGANPIQIFFRITLPLLKPTIVVALIFRTLDALRVFDILYIMTGSNENTMSMSIYARQQMVDFQDVGFGSAASVTIFVILTLFTVGYMYTTRMDFNK